MFSWRRSMAVAKKEYLELRRNPLLYMALMLGPLMFYLLHAYGLPLDIKNIPLGVLDMDKSALSRSLQDTFENSNVFNVKRSVNDTKTLTRALSLSEMRAGIVIPPDFSVRLNRGLPVTIQAMVDGSYPNQALISIGYIESAVNFFNLDQLEQYFQRAGGTAAGGSMPIEINATVWDNSTFNGNYFLLPGLFGLTLVFFPAIMAALSLTKEKETRSILNFYSSSVTKTEYLLGKMLPYVIIAFFQCLLCFVHAVFIMSVPMRGSLLAFVIAAWLFSAAAVGTGLLIGVFLSSQSTAILLTTIITLTFTFTYSGVLTPVMCLSEDSRVISNLLPVTYFIDVARRVMIRGASFGQVQDSLMVLFVFCLALYGASILIFKKRLS